MNQNSALERIVARQKPKVPPRTDVLEEATNFDVKTALSQNSENQSTQDQFEALRNNSSELVEQSESLDVKTSFSQDLENQSTQDQFETVRNTIRIESNVDEALRQLCHTERITKETLLEAAYLFLQEHPEQLAEVVSLAQERLQQRKAIANYQRAKTMQQRFLNS